MAKKGAAKKEEVKEPKIMFYTWKATGEKDKKGKPIFERVPVYEKPKPEKEGMKKWVLKEGKSLKEYQTKLAEISTKDRKIYYAKRQALDAEYYEKIIAADNKKYSSKSPKFFIKWVDGVRWKCDPISGKKLEKI